MTTKSAINIFEMKQRANIYAYVSTFDITTNTQANHDDGFVFPHFASFLFLKPSKTLISMFSFTWRFFGLEYENKYYHFGEKCMFAPFSWLLKNDSLVSRFVSQMEIFNTENAFVYLKCKRWFLRVDNNEWLVYTGFHAPTIPIEIRSWKTRLKLNLFFLLSFHIFTDEWK